MIQILVFADLHGKLPQIPKKWRNKETIIVMAGDIADNYPEQTFTLGYMSGDVFTHSNWRMWNFRKIDTVLESELQSGWVQTKLIPHLIDNKINLDNVIAINGNHDFFDTSKFFKNGLDIGSKTITIQGIKFLAGEFAGWDVDWSAWDRDWEPHNDLPLVKLFPSTERAPHHVHYHRNPLRAVILRLNSVVGFAERALPIIGHTPTHPQTLPRGATCTEILSG